VKVGEGRFVLVVDDDPDYCEVTQTRLESQGFEVKCVSSGNKALEWLKSAKPDLIIMDIDMPNKDGLTTLINLSVQMGRKEKTPDRIPVLVATGIQSERVKQMVMDYDVDDFLQKPFEAEELIEKVGRLIQ